MFALLLCVGVVEVKRRMAFKRAVETAEVEKEEWERGIMRSFGVIKGSPHSPVLQMLMRAMEDDEIINVRQAAAQSGNIKDI